MNQQEEIHPSRLATSRSIDNSTPEKLCEELGEFINDVIRVSREERMLVRVSLHPTSKDGSIRIYCRAENELIEKHNKQERQIT